MNKKLVAAIVGSAVGVGIGGIIRAKRCMDAYIEGYERAVCEFYETKLDEAYEYIAELNKQIPERDKLLTRSMGQTERLIRHINEESEES